MLLVFQLIFAVIATHRGHGFYPWMYLFAGYGIAFGLGVTFYTLPLETITFIGAAIGWVMVILLGYMAFNPPE